MIKQFSVIFLTGYFLFGSLCLPNGDFSYIVDLPDMYRHCKAAEDHDMGPIDFLTDHLINIDGVFDKHTNGDHQKPHQNTEAFRTSSAVSFLHEYPSVNVSIPPVHQSRHANDCENLYAFHSRASIFHPPAA